MTTWNANLYDQKHHYVSEYGQTLLHILKAQPDERILDVGCGTGDLTARIAKEGAKVTGVDLNESMILQAQKKYPHINFSVEDAENLPFKNEFDAIFSNAAMHWMHNQEAVLKAFYHALKSGGRIVIELGGENNIKQVTDAIQSAFNQAGEDFSKVENPWTFPKTKVMETMLNQVGFKNIQVEHFERPTELIGEDGLNNWLDMFSNLFFVHLSKDKKDEIYKIIQANLKPKLFKDGKWMIDYKRLRIYAEK